MRLLLPLLLVVCACTNGGGGASSDQELAQKLGQGLRQACPLADPGDEEARNACAAALTDYVLLKDAMANPFLWGGQQEQDGGVTDGWSLDGHVTKFDPRVFRRMYLSLYSFGGDFTVEAISGGRTALHLTPRFRNKLDMGSYPYPFWHRISKWESYQLANELVLIIKDRKIQGAQRSFAAKTDRSDFVTHEWGGQWEWRRGGEVMPFNALYTYLFSKENPYVKDLDAAYRAMETKLRAQNCMVCHSPDNGPGMEQLELFSYPNQALTGRHRIVEQLEQNAMPTLDPPRGFTLGMADEAARQELLGLARRFAALGDQAMAWDGENAVSR